MNWSFFVGVLHWVFSFTVSFYPFLFRRSWVDYLHICYAVFIMIHWTMLNGDCIITYWSKKQTNPSYKAGQTPLENKDMYIFPISDRANNWIIQFMVSVWLYSIYRVYTRNKYPRWIPILLVVLFLVYKWELVETNDHVHNRRFLYRQHIIQILLLVVLFSTVYYTIM